MLKFRLLIACFLLTIPLRLAAFSTSLQLSVESEWGNANHQDVAAVLNSASEVMSAYIGGRTLDNIIVRNDSRGPISLYERGEQGEYIVLLDVGGRYWAQLAYQFSHEACHLLSNYDLAPNNITRQQWFEESLCEAFSLFILNRMAEQWAESPPYPNWKSYAPELKKYVDNMQQQEHRHPAENLSDWYHQQKAVLEDNPYARNRELNEKMASHLLAKFEENPEHWAAINFLNLGEDTEDRTLNKYLQDWYDNVPDTHKAIVVSIQQMLDADQIAEKD